MPKAEPAALLRDVVVVARTALGVADMVCDCMAM